MSAHRAVLITRSAGGADPYADYIVSRGYDVLYAPMLDIELVDTPLPDLSPYNAFVFTSAHAVKLFAALSDERDKRIFTVGDVTAQAARDQGFADVVSAGGNAANLAALLVKQEGTAYPLYLRGEDVTRPLPGVEEHILYRAMPVDSLPPAVSNALESGEIVAAAFFSARGAENFARLIQQNGQNHAISGINALCLSGAVLESLSVLPWQETRMAETPDRDGMMRLLAAMLA